MNKKLPFAPSYESDGVMGKNSEKHPRRSERQQTGKQAPDFFNTTPSSE
ncbi:MULTISPECIES: hypothetical protein [Geobacillus]|nr:MULTISPECIES: hypothetical protein [Geobacillus]KPC98266.1 hypothetical protein LR69_03537 [Geobacillus sp. BCO2]